MRVQKAASGFGETGGEVMVEVQKDETRPSLQVNCV